MPAYFSIEVSYKYEELNKNFVKNIYEVIFEMFPFKEGYWNGEKDSLDEIIIWNQKLLEKKFKLGFSENVKNNYKQILLRTTLCEHMRLFWMYHDNEIRLIIIIPEYDILEEENDLIFNYNKLKTIIKLCKNIWEKTKAVAIQSYLELDAPVDIKTILSGKSLPTMNPFCIIDKNTLELLNTEQENINQEFLRREGVLIINKSFFSIS